MRHGQQNRRGRGRSSRKGHNHHNPLMRTYQSNGPDQKIHGTPAQIAEKYMSLARDALSSGDPVLAENYLQHAEHYNRIILVYREQQLQHGDAVNGTAARGRPGSGSEQPADRAEVGDEQVDDDDLVEGAEEVLEPEAAGAEVQPRGFEAAPANAEDSVQADAGDRPERGYRSRGSDQRSYGREQRERPARATRGERSERQQRGQREAAATGNGEADPTPRRRDRFADTQSQPEFLRRPVRRTRRDSSLKLTTEEETSAVVTTDGGAGD